MSTRPPSLEIVPETIGNILSKAQRRLRVPINQRSYSWKNEHINDLYRDWAAAMDNLGREEYFLGSIVVVGVEDSMEVFDGQQRLATSMILVAAIRDYFYQSGDKKTAGIIETEFLISEDRKSHDPTPHFRLNAEDHDFFLKRVLRPPDDVDRKTIKAKSTKESHKRIEEAASIAADHVRREVSNLPETDKGKRLHRWLDFIEKGARVIWVQVAETRTAFTIFETMNDRGLKLSAADLLKNYLYGTAESRENEVILKWQSMCATLESIGENEGEIVDYIRYFWIVGHGHTRSKDLYDHIKGEVNNKTKVVTFTSELESRSRDYAAILSGSHEAWTKYGPGAGTKVDTLCSLGLTQVRPLLLAAFRKFSEKEFKKLLHACVCWSVRCLITGVPSGTLEGYYGRSAHNIFQGNIKDVSKLTGEMVPVIPDDDRFRAAAATANVAQAHLARYYLRALQLHADGASEPQYVPSEEATLEHIMPAKPGDNWPNITPDEAKANCNRLGNQVLLQGSVNSKLGNAKFKEKKIALKESSFSLTREIADIPDWGIQEITQRQKRLADLAILVWPLKV